LRFAAAGGIVAAMIDVKTKQLRQMERDLKLFNARALPYATRQTVNSLAFAARKDWQGEMAEAFTLRNQWTQRSVRVEQTRTLDIRRQESVVGSMAGYLEDQESGATLQAQGQEGRAIPTPYSSGEGMAARPRKRVPRRPNRMKSIDLSNRRVRAASRAQRNYLLVRQAAESGRRFIYMETDRVKGIFRVIGGKRRPRVRLVHNMSHQSVRIPRTPTLQPALEKTQPKADVLYRKALRFQLRRHGILGYGRR